MSQGLTEFNTLPWDEILGLQFCLSLSNLKADKTRSSHLISCPQFPHKCELLFTVIPQFSQNLNIRGHKVLGVHKQ